MECDVVPKQILKYDLKGRWNLGRPRKQWIQRNRPQVYP